MLGRKSNDSNWISIADMMTALMVIFMFIAINNIVQIIEYKFVEKEIYNTLSEKFTKEISDGSIQLGGDGTIRFTPKDNANLFNSGQSSLTKNFEIELDNFLPKYWEIITSDDYLEYISEIRIEGHADTIPPPNIKTDEENYLFNLDLSSQRAAAVLKYVRNHSTYINASEEQKERMDFLFASIGYSFSRTLNEDGEFTYMDDVKDINNDLSRRVEFKIITTNESLVEKIYEANER